METISIVKRKARKEHICDNCGSKIFKGEEYEVQTNKQDIIYKWKLCNHCKELRRQMFIENYYPDGATDQDFDDFLADHPEIEFKRR